jgi:hypothetical protein
MLEGRLIYLGRRRIGYAALSLFLAAVWLGAGVQRASADEAAAMYDPATVVVIDLTLPQASVDALEAEPDEYQPGTFSLAESDGTPAGVGASSSPLPVQVRLKGKASFKPLTGKAAFKLKFGKTERFLGLKKMTLNNMIEDPSMLHETLTYAAFRAADVPAPRTGFAYLRVNGEDFGLYLNIETLDDVALARLFGSFDDETQHLYEGESGHDVKPGEAGEFEVDEGDEADLSDLEALIEAVDPSGPGTFSERVAAAADLAEMTRMWAVEKYVAHWDGYSGRAGASQPNNYYLLSDPMGRFQMLPWGSDETWSYDHPVSFDGPGGVMFNECLADPACAAMYRDAVVAAKEAVASIDPLALADDTAALLRPWQVMENAESERPVHDMGEIAEGVAETRRFIRQRPAEVNRWLGLEDPPLVVPLPVTPIAPPAGVAPLTRAMRISSAAVRGGVLRTRLTLAAAGTATQRATARIRGQRVLACKTSRSVEGPRPVLLECRLSKAALARLRHRSLRLSVATRFFSADGVEVLRRRVLAHRA